LRPVQDVFKPADFPDLLIGLEGPDDAAVWRLDESRAIVVTADFFTPVVDDGYDYGAIAAANSLSDIYAMGGLPFMALNIAALPEDLPLELMSAILRGGAEKAREAGVVIAGGHTVKDKEPKYGLVAIGFVDPRKALTKGALQVGDRLVLTKPLGFGVTTTALKNGKAVDEDVREVVEWMKRLNRTAGQLASECGLRAATDVTGFGLMGHAWEMASAAGVRLEIDFQRLPLVAGARKYANMGAFASGLFDNRAYFKGHVEIAPQLDEPDEMLLFDPQTSGGLLLGVPEDKLALFERRAGEQNQAFWAIGTVREGSGIQVQ
jgi:selenide, water dikinase